MVIIVDDWLGAAGAAAMGKLQPVVDKALNHTGEKVGALVRACCEH